MIDKNPIFTYGYLCEILKNAKKTAPISTLRDRPTGPCIILRHDVDLDIYSAYELSKIEQEIDVISTFFIMTTCPFYNVSSINNRKMLREMAEKGFEIGLHFDPVVYGIQDDEYLKRYVDIEARLLEEIIEQPISSISLHNPSVTDRYPIFEGYNNAYSKDIFSDDLYLSDSCMEFRGKNPIEFVERARTRPVQMVLHPIHWSHNGDDYIEIFSKYIKRNVKLIDDSFKVNPTYVKSLEEKELHKIILSKGGAK